MCKKNILANVSPISCHGSQLLNIDVVDLLKEDNGSVFPRSAYFGLWKWFEIQKFRWNWKVSGKRILQFQFNRATLSKLTLLLSSSLQIISIYCLKLSNQQSLQPSICRCSVYEHYFLVYLAYCTSPLKFHANFSRK